MVDFHQSLAFHYQKKSLCQFEIMYMEIKSKKSKTSTKYKWYWNKRSFSSETQNVFFTKF